MIQRERTEKTRKGKGRVAAVLAAVLLVTSVTALNGLADPLPLQYLDDGETVKGGSVSITIPDADTFNSLRTLNNEGQVAVDLYEVAAAKKMVVDGFTYDAYTFDWTGSDFAGCEAVYQAIQKKSETDEGSVTAEDINNLTQELAGVVNEGSVTKEPVTGVLDEPIPVSKGGLYLILVHTKGSDPEGYFTDADPDTPLTTVVKGDGSQYQFAPMLASVPNRGLPAFGEELFIDGDEEAAFGAAAGSTSNLSDEWDYDAAIEAKVKASDLYGSLRINKTLDNHENVEGRIDPATFVFSIVGRMEGQADPVFTDVVSMTFTTMGSDSREIKKIPVGAQVTVEEIYHGSTEYSEIAYPTGPVTIIADDPATSEIEMAEVSFENVYDSKKWNGGGSVDNHFGTVEDNDGKIRWGAESSTKTMADDAGTGIHVGELIPVDKEA